VPPRLSIRAVLSTAAATLGVVAAVRWSPLPAPGAPHGDGSVRTTRQITSAPAAAAPGGARSGADARAAVIVSAIARVERSARGSWIAAREGDALEASEGLRTGAGGTAEVSLGGARLTVDEGSEIDVREIGPTTQRVRLVRGRVAVDQRGAGGRTLRVEGRTGTVAASAGGGRWAAVASADALAVAVVEGLVRLDSAGQAVDVGMGREAAAWHGAPPLAPSAVPSAVVVRLARAIAERRRSVCAVLHVGVASEVRVNGEPAAVAPDGRVLVRVAHADRRRPVEVAVRHANGSVQRRVLRCAEDDAPVSEVEVRWNVR
jgi:hypothetical protein